MNEGGFLADLGREYLLAGHLIDRAGMPQVISRFGREAMLEVAIEEWMGASPVYSRRVQRALGFGGDDVATIFKGMQLDIGAPHQFMDFRYEVTDADHGEFWLAHCGALMDVEPLGDEFVVGMCHHIEDPTFDATACATNPRARMRPVHRPPRVPADRHPHCHWTVTIEHDEPPLPEPDAAVRVAQSRAASVELGPAVVPTYAGPLDPDFRLEKLPEPALRRALEEVCLQGHLLVHSFLLVVERRWGAETARELGVLQFAGVAGVVATRLVRAFGCDVAGVLELHPAFLPTAYVQRRVETDGDVVRFSIEDCPALDEVGGWSWPALLREDDRPLQTLVQTMEPHAQVVRVGDLRWDISIDPAAPPAKEPSTVTLT
ncbi:MAG: hypothetical protein QOG87_4174, partial [Actinomycetota bacterium]